MVVLGLRRRRRERRQRDDQRRDCAHAAPPDPPRRRRLAIAAAALCVLPIAATASAQPKRWEASAAYDFTRDWTSDINYAAGWTGGTAFGLNDWLSAIGEVGASYKNIPVTGSEAELRLYTFLGGVRVRRTTHRFTEFGQIAAGAAHARGTVFDITNTSTHPAVQAGGGGDFAVTPRLFLRVQIDFRVVFGGQQVDSQHHARFLAGIAYAVH